MFLIKFNGGGRLMELKNLSTKYFGRNFLFLERVDSTNTYLKQNSHLQHGFAVMAGEQFAGRGRRGNSWLQRPGDSLAFSVLIHNADIADMGVLPLICGIAAAKALGKDGRVKWPNDVVINGKKICGILCESLICSGKVSAVCGFGVNLLQSSETFTAEGLVHASSVLAQTGVSISQQDAMCAILNNLEKLWDEYRLKGFKSMINQYADICITLSKTVKVIKDGTETVCTAKAINPDGSLLCSLNGTDFSVRAGDTSVRGIYGYV